MKAEAVGEAFLLRAVHDGFTCLSALWGIPQGDGHMELVLMARDGQSRRTVSDPSHHHVTALTRDAKAYAEALNMKGFLIRTSTRRPGFFAKRFPEWDAVTVDGVNLAILEVR